MTDQQQIFWAIEAAAITHQDQKDRLDTPYVVHVARVVERCRMSIDPTVIIVAWLHDVPEDHSAGREWALDWLRRRGFSERVLAAVDAITRHEGEIYTDYIKRLAKDPIAFLVKNADLDDHLDPSFNRGLTDSLRERYLEARRLLGQAYARQEPEKRR